MAVVKKTGGSPRHFRATVDVMESRRLLSTIYADVHNTTGIENGTAAHPYHLIQTAIESAAPSGDTIKVAAGTYAEALVVDHSVTILGPNANVNPNTQTRSAEAIIVPPVDGPNYAVNILVESSDVTINGLTVDGHNAALTGGTVLNGVSVNAKSGVSNVDPSGNQSAINKLTVLDDILENFTGFGVIGDSNPYTGAPVISTGNVISNNKIDNVPVVDVAPIGTSLQGRGISIEDDFYASITNNVITRCATGIQTIFELDVNGSASTTTISNNSVQAYDRGILAYTVDTNTAALTISNNTITTATGSTATSVGLDLNRILSSTTATVTGNSVSTFNVGIQLAESSTTSTIKITNGYLYTNAIGVRLTNANTDVTKPNTTQLPVAATLTNVKIFDNSLAGVNVVDANNSLSTPATLTIDTGTAAWNSPHGASLSGLGAAIAETANPTATFTSTPSSQTTSTSATFTFALTDPISTLNDINVQYTLDGGSAQYAESPINLTNLATGKHTLVLTATDQAGKVVKIQYTWTIS